MKKHIFAIIAAVLCCIMCLTACGAAKTEETGKESSAVEVSGETSKEASSEASKAEESSQSKTEKSSSSKTEESSAAPAADTKKAPVPFPESAAGSYHDAIAGRGMMTLTMAGDGCDVVIDWPSSAAEFSHFEMHAVWGEDGKATYKNGTLVTTVYDEDGKATESKEYTDGTGTFEYKDGKVLWTNGKDGNTSEFVKDDAAAPVGLPNPWTETESLDEAVNGSGVSFAPPEDALASTGLKLWHYRYMQGTVEAVYESINDELIIRKSSVSKGDELSGDYTQYSKEWTQSVKGLEVSCKGDGSSANVITFTSGDYGYSISYNAGIEGRGLGVNDITPLIMGMQ